MQGSVVNASRSIPGSSSHCVVAGGKDQGWGNSGSVIGSLLFLLFVNDLASLINVTTLLFADDIKIV